MDDLIELLIELLIDGSLELLPNKKIPKWLRVILFLFLIGIILSVIVLGTLILAESLLVGFIIILSGLILLMGFIIKIKKHNK